MAIGDVVRVTMFDNIDQPYMWGVDTDGHREMPNVYWLIGAPGDDYSGETDTDLDPALDHWEVVPPEEWPDDVCAAVAKWRLTE